MRWTRNVARIVDKRAAHRVLVGIPNGKKVLRRPRRRWEGNIKIDLQEVGLGHGLNCFGSGRGQVAGTSECGNEPFLSIKCGEFLD